MSWALQFGIPSFDVLFGRPDEARQVDAADQKSYDYGAYGIHLSEKNRTTSMCFIGPDGTGKSVFGLHLAGQYMAGIDLDRTYIDETLPDGKNQRKWHPRAFYVSTDLKHSVAEVMWTNFGLDQPNKREFPFAWGYRKGCEFLDRAVMLAKVDPADIQPALLEDSTIAKVHFVDLVSRTMGDDWGFISRLLAVLKSPLEGCQPHLLVIDAVEGFETLVGEKDAFGETTSRRARIAQIMRTAGEKCHVCFIVEEPRNEERFPEEFVTDVVVRLRSATINNYARRTVEIVKARGQNHVRGQHPFTIRDRWGATTGLQGNADEPTVKNSYAHVFPSLHYLSREEMKRPGPSNPDHRSKAMAAFGITYLDEMLARLPENPEEVYLDDQGLPPRTTTALIGEIATQKTSLATAFLARTFRGFVFRLADMIRELETLIDSKPAETRLLRDALKMRLSFANVIRCESTNEIPDIVLDKLIKALMEGNTPTFKAQLQEFKVPFPDLGGCTDFQCLRQGDARALLYLAGWLVEGLEGNGIAVLLTTGDQDRDRLVGEFEGWLANSCDKALRNWPKDVTEPKSSRPLSPAYPFREIVRQHLRSRTVCRRLELHDLSSAILYQIIQRSIERAQQLVFLSEDLRDTEDRLPYRRSVRHERSWNIRVVIDDLTILKDTYTDISADPLFLPSLLSYLEWEGVTSLIVDSQMGRPDMPVRDGFDRELRALVPHKLLTWRVPFYGEIRDAITVVPPYPTGLPSLVREIRWEDRGDSHPSLIVDPELELYAGLEKNDPRPIPLEVRLYEETGPTADYIREENNLFNRLFTPITRTPESGEEQKISEVAEVIKGVAPGQYDALRDFCNLQTDTLLDHTMLFQVDEFWASNRQPVGDLSRFPRGPISRREGALYPLGGYLDELTSGYSRSNTLQPDRIADPFGLFQGTPSKLKLQLAASGDSEAARPIGSSNGKGPWKRHQYFTRSAQGLWEGLKPSEIARIDRIPYTWDFGFLLCSPSLWELAADRSAGYRDMTVGKVWENMPTVHTRTLPESYISWRAFLGACKTVAHLQAERSSLPMRILDLSINVGESLSCLLFEVWASEIMDSLTELERNRFFNQVSRVQWGAPASESLKDWIRKDDYVVALYKSWLLLLESLTLSDLIDR
jgi:KaiC/GvpD/RAD55 family RecA-like ATPase